MDALKQIRDWMQLYINQGKSIFTVKDIHFLMNHVHSSYDIPNPEQVSFCYELHNFFADHYRCNDKDTHRYVKCPYTTDILERAFIMLIAVQYSTYTSAFRDALARWILIRRAILHNDEALFRLTIDRKVGETAIEDKLAEYSRADVGVEALSHVRNLYITAYVEGESKNDIARFRNNALKSFRWLNTNFMRWKKHPIFPFIGKFPLFTQLPLFYLTYHDVNVRELMEEQAMLYRNLLNKWYSQVEIDYEFPKEIRNGKRKVGFLSRSLRSHSVGRIAYGLIEKLGKSKQFDIYIYADNNENTVVGDRIRAVAKKVVFMEHQLQKIIEDVRNDHLDILILLDPLQDTLTYIISHYRCAPVQITTWGHPGTTGLDTIDYYITSKYFKDDPGHYNESLVAFDSLSIFYNHINDLVKPYAQETDFDLIPYIESKGGVNFARHMNNVPLGARVYGIVGPIFKLSVDFDHVIVEILKRDPNAYITMHRGEHDAQLLSFVKRLESKIDEKEMDRIFIIPKRLELLEFSFYIYGCTLILDSFPFGGLISSYDTFSVGRCMVALPCNRLGKFTAGLYDYMGKPELVEHLIAKDVDEYVMKALRIAQDDGLRKRLEAQIVEGCKKIHYDADSIADWTSFLKSVQPRGTLSQGKEASTN